MTCYTTYTSIQEKFNIQFGLSKNPYFGMEDKEAYSPRIYFDPGQGMQMVMDLGTYTGSSIVDIYDLHGRLLYNKKITGNNYQIGEDSIRDRGMYLIKIKNNNGEFTKIILNPL